MAIILILGIVAIAAGFVSLFKPLQFLRIRSRGMGVAVLIAGIVLVGIGGSGSPDAPVSSEAVSTVAGAATSEAPPLQASEPAAPSEGEASEGVTSAASESGASKAGASETGASAAQASTTEASGTPAPQKDNGGFGDGTYRVGKDIKSGVYRSTGTGFCYWARLKGFSGEFDDILANGNNAPEIVAIAGSDAGFETRGCGRWVPVSTIKNKAATKFGDGTYRVGADIKPGTYRASGDELCYWARLKGFAHDFNDIIANGNQATIVTIKATDAGFTTFGCGTWTQS